MSYAPALSVGFVASFGLTGCPEEGTNAPTLWLAPDGAETRVRLIEDRPPPF
jgi:hypothetical protein